LSELTVNLQEAIAGFGGIARAGNELALMFQDSGEAHRRSLHGLRDAALDALLDLGRTSEDARRIASRIKSVDLTALCEQALPNIENALRRIAKRLDELCIRLRTGDIDVAEMEVLRAQYSMRSERIVHAQSLGASAEAALGDFGGDIELF